jgi:hypothetical protein
MNNLDFLRVYNSPWPKQRIGNPDADGGYIIIDIPDVNYETLISGGIEKDLSFEQDFNKKYNSKCIAFDHTITELPYLVENLQWVKKAISNHNSDTATNLKEYIETNRDIFVKLDIEGGEYDLFESLSPDDINQFKQIVVEFHFPWKEENKINILKKLSITHTILHAHGNNCCGTTQYDGVTVPAIFELTYINNSLLKDVPLSSNTTPIPHPLDRPNIKTEEIYLHKYPFVW